jgi:hypothetical protein
MRTQKFRRREVASIWKEGRKEKEAQQYMSSVVRAYLLYIVFNSLLINRYPTTTYAAGTCSSESLPR